MLTWEPNLHSLFIQNIENTQLDMVKIIYI